MGLAFEQDTAYRLGKLGESAIARWLRARQNCVLPVYEKQIDEGKGPRFFAPSAEIVAPDMFVFPKMIWVEAKHKTVFSWHRRTQRWVTGIDVHHYAGYQSTHATSGCPVWILFLHRCDTPDFRDIEWGCPAKCPVGLFGGEIEYLIQNENHRDPRGSPRGMVYWAHETLKKFEDISWFEQAGAFYG